MGDIDSIMRHQEQRITELEADFSAANTAREQAERETAELREGRARMAADLKSVQDSRYGLYNTIDALNVAIDTAHRATEQAERTRNEAVASAAALTGLVQEGIDVLGSGFLSGWVVWDDMEGCQFCMARAPRGAYTNVSHDADCPVPLGRIYVKRAKAALAGMAGADLAARVARLEALANRIIDEASEWTAPYVAQAQAALAAQPGGEAAQ